MADSILDIITKADRRPFTIDGKYYEMRHPNELSMTEFHQLSKKGAALIALADEYKSDPDGAFKSITMCTNELLDMITPDLPSEVRETLNPFGVQQILEAFIGLSRTEPKPDVQPLQKKSLPDSSDSTADARKTG